MRYRCSNCTEAYVVGDSTSLYPQSFCSKGCEVESVVVGHNGENLMSVLAAMESKNDLMVEMIELVH